MTRLSQSDVEKLAELSKLQLTDEESERITHDLTESIQYVSNLSEVDTQSVPGTFFTTDAINVMDEDEVDEHVMLTSAEALKNARFKKDGYFVVKRIL